MHDVLIAIERLRGDEQRKEREGERVKHKLWFNTSWLCCVVSTLLSRSFWYSRLRKFISMERSTALM